MDDVKNGRIVNIAITFFHGHSKTGQRLSIERWLSKNKVNKDDALSYHGLIENGKYSRGGSTGLRSANGINRKQQENSQIVSMEWIDKK